ncbi:septum formation initiator family protein [Candidatus Gottesmanbacteria bacterium]|nr:septum formation initiator family protein [Candidatus Gottesmanbacteria bacterium]
MKYRLINWLFLILAVTFVGNIIRTIASLSREDNIIKEANDRLQKATDENQSLKKGLAQVGSEDFIEREARNRLNLSKEGELVLIMPSISPGLTPTPTPSDTSANWQKWVKLFL